MQGHISNGLVLGRSSLSKYLFLSLALFTLPRTTCDRIYQTIVPAVPNVPNTNRPAARRIFPIGLRRDVVVNLSLYLKYTQPNKPIQYRRSTQHSVTVRSIVRIKLPPRRRPYNSAARSSP